MMRWLWFALAVVLAAGIGYSVRGPGPAPVPVIPPAYTQADRLPPLLEAAVETLAESGWDAAAGRAVVGFHRRWLTDLFDADRPAFDLVIMQLRSLPGARGLGVVLKRRPELAGLLCLVKDPDALARELEGPNGDAVASLFLVHHNRGDAEELAAALPENASLITNLSRRGLGGAETLFIFPRGTQASQDYEKWLRGAVQTAIAQPYAELAATFLLVLEEGPAIRERMAADDKFRVRFPDSWGKLQRVTARRHEDVAPYVGLPGLWDFLENPDAEALMADWGPLPVDLLHSPDSRRRYPPEHQGRVRKLLAAGDESIADLLILCRGEPAFYPFLKAELPLDLLRGVSADLAARQGRLGPRLVVLQGKLGQSQDALREAVGLKSAGPKEFVPFYSLYKVYGDYADGEEPSTIDLVFAAVDVATVILPVGKVVAVPGKEAAKLAGKAAGRAAAEAAVKGQARQKAAGRLGLVAANPFAVRIAVKTRLVEFLTQVAQRGVRWNTSGLSHASDITELVRYVYGRGGRDPLRRLAGLDPRVLLAPDGRVHLRLTWSRKITHRRQLALWPFKKEATKWAMPTAAAHSPAVEPVSPVPGDRRDETERPAETLDWAALAGGLWLASAADLLPDPPEPTELPAPTDPARMR